MGLAGSGAMWWRLLPHLARRHRVIVLDNRGTGDSAPAHRPLSMGEMAGDAVAVLDAAGVGEAHVMGASMGGMIAQHVALDHRDRVASLILACTTPGGRQGAPNGRLLAASLLRPFVGPRRTGPIVAPALYAQRTRDERRERMVEDFRHRMTDKVGGLTAWMQMAAIAGHDTRARLGELARLPTLVIHGEEDVLVPIERGRELAAGIPGAKLVEIPECGHLLSTDAEETVVASVLEHLERGAVAV
jgi:pimeloyl-ACP methyl ester carboxylesterase